METRRIERSVRALSCGKQGSSSGWDQLGRDMPEQRRRREYNKRIVEMECC
jgi:hypothetical protein